MHNVDIDLIEMTLDVMKYAVKRITDTEPMLGVPREESDLRAAVGETITPKGIGGERAFQLFRDVLVKASVRSSSSPCFCPCFADPRGHHVRPGHLCDQCSRCVLAGGSRLYIRRERSDAMAGLVDRAA
jgi:hypothetical protein